MFSHITLNAALSDILTTSFKKDVLVAFDDGRLRSYIHSVYPWTKIIEAHQEMEADKNMYVIPYLAPLDLFFADSSIDVNCIFMGPSIQSIVGRSYARLYEFSMVLYANV